MNSVDSLAFVADSLQHVLADSVINSMNSEQEIMRQMREYEAERDETISVILGSVVTVVVLGSFILFNLYNSRYWDRGIFPPIMRNRRVNHYEAILNISVSILLCDQHNYVDKQQYLANFLQRRYPEITGGINHSVRSAVTTPLKPESVAAWLGKKMTDPQDKKDVLAFFVSLASLDQVIGKRELNILTVVAAGLKVDTMILNDLVDRQRRLKAERIEQERKTVSAVRPSDYRREKAAKVLGLNPGCTIGEVKKAYRKLAMINHPDKFQNGSRAEQARAKERFLEIQEAYEYFEDTLSVG